MSEKKSKGLIGKVLAAAQRRSKERTARQANNARVIREAGGISAKTLWDDEETPRSRWKGLGL